MSEKKPAPASPALTREQRLAAKLRENLHRRKSQARALNESSSESADESDAESGNQSGRAD